MSTTSSFFPTSTTTTATCHLMVDLETLAISHDAPILSIGAVLFDPTRQNTFEELSEHAFLAIIDPGDAVNVCGPVQGDTLRWWFQQPDEAVKRLVSAEAVSVRQALKALWSYAGHPTHIWARSPDFDCTILQSACKATKIPYPFPFYQQRCVRTALDLAYPNGDGPQSAGGVRHDARDDATQQAVLVQACYAVLGLGQTPTSPA